MPSRLRVLRCHAHPPLIPSCRCQLLTIIDSHTQTFCSCFRKADFQSLSCMARAFKSFLSSMFAWCMCDRRAHDTGENSPGCAKINNFLKCTSPPLMSIRFDAELKEVPNEARPRGDVRLVTPRGPSASTIESLEKALQTVGRTPFLLHFPPFILVTLLSQKLKGRFKV